MTWENYRAIESDMLSCKVDLDVLSAACSMLWDGRSNLQRLCATASAPSASARPCLRKRWNQNEAPLGSSSGR